MEMLDDHFTLSLSRILLSHEGFVVHYPDPRPNNAHGWFFVARPDSVRSWAIHDDVVKKLLEDALIAPNLSDEEYRVQIALGSIDCRVYKIVSKTEKKE